MIKKIINRIKNKMIGKIDPKEENEITRIKKIKKCEQKSKNQIEKKKKREKENLKKKEMLELANIRHKEDDFICSICLNYITKTITTVCGHSFCEICIFEYLLYFVVN